MLDSRYFLKLFVFVIRNMRILIINILYNKCTTQYDTYVGVYVCHMCGITKCIGWLT